MLVEYHMFLEANHPEEHFMIVQSQILYHKEIFSLTIFIHLQFFTQNWRSLLLVSLICLSILWRW